MLNLNLMNPLALQDVDNEMLRDADEYLRKHKILELFEVSDLIVWPCAKDLTTLLAYKQPDNIDQFIIDQVKIRKENGTRSIVYTDQELQNIFTLYDLKGAGHITKEQTREALKTLANSEFHFTKAQEAVIPTKVDLFTFMKVCDDVLGIKWNETDDYMRDN